jgi:hypothetical protein
VALAAVGIFWAAISSKVLLSASKSAKINSPTNHSSDLEHQVLSAGAVLELLEEH